MERELGDKTHDGAIRRGQHHILRPIGRLQSRPRIHWRIHLPVNAV